MTLKEAIVALTIVFLMLVTFTIWGCPNPVCGTTEDVIVVHAKDIYNMSGVEILETKDGTETNGSLIENITFGEFVVLEFVGYLPETSAKHHNESNDETDPNIDINIEGNKGKVDMDINNVTIEKVEGEFDIEDIFNGGCYISEVENSNDLSLEIWGESCKSPKQRRWRKVESSLIL